MKNLDAKVDKLASKIHEAPCDTLQLPHNAPAPFMAML